MSGQPHPMRSLGRRSKSTERRSRQQRNSNAISLGAILSWCLKSPPPHSHSLSDVITSAARIRCFRTHTIYYLPGVIVNTLDGGLTAAFAPQDDSILIIGTAGQGVVNTPYQVTDRALAAQEFGFAGTLERGIEECATNSDNILAFRCGTKPMVLTGVGLDTTVGSTAPGFDITFSDVTSDAGTRYQIWYKAGVLSGGTTGHWSIPTWPMLRLTLQKLHPRAARPGPPDPVLRVSSCLRNRREVF